MGRIAEIAMGGRRKSSKPQGIRKKRKGAATQTLARVAQRKEEHQVKLEAKIEQAEQNARAIRVGRLGLLPEIAGRETEQRRSAEEQEILRVANADETDEHSQIVARKVEGRQNAYKDLVKSIHESHNPKANGVRPKHDDVSAREDVRVERKQNGDGTPQKHSVDVSKKVIEEENYAAAVREKNQYNSQLKPSNTVLKFSSIGVYSGVGKVLAAVSPERRSLLERSLTSDLKSTNISALGMQPSMYAKWKDMNGTGLTTGDRGEELSSCHQAFIRIIREYQDVLFCRKLSELEERSLRKIYVAHLLSHVIRSRNLVLRNDVVLKKGQDDSETLKDQGFSRARVLILLPMKNVAYDVVKTLMALAVGAESGEKDVSHIANRERFEEEFAPDPEDGGDDGIGEPTETDEHPSQSEKGGRKPRDHKWIFRGNVEDDFKLGITFTKKTVKLYSDFYASDIIIASPLGLRRSIAEKATGQGTHARKRREKQEGDTEWKTGLSAGARKAAPDEADDDFLSSVEICVVDGAHVFSMQNWDTVLQTMGMMNKMPNNTRDTDFSRVREWCLDGLMANFRQTIVLSDYRKSEFVSLFRECQNHAGRVQLIQTPREHGSMVNVVVNIRQTFMKVPEVESPVDSPEKRLNFFFNTVFPKLRSLVDSQCLVVVPSYFDYVRVRNKLLKISEDDSSFHFASMCEYSKGRDISRARSRLYDRSVSLVVMTERFHFFWRHWIRGANSIVWFGLPENCEFYAEILNMTAEASEVGRPVQSTALFDKFDSFALERIVGQKRSKRMTAKASRSTYLFAQ